MAFINQTSAFLCIYYIKLPCKYQTCAHQRAQWPHHTSVLFFMSALAYAPQLALCRLLSEFNSTATKHTARLARLHYKLSTLHILDMYYGFQQASREA